MNYAFRQLAKSPGFSAIAILTLALGIGLSASSFSLANAFLLRTVPYPEADRLVSVVGTSRQSDRDNHAPGNLMDIRERVTSFSGFAIYNGDFFSLGEPGQPAERVLAMNVAANFFDVLRLQPAHGRGFTPADFEADPSSAAILTHRAWVRRYAMDPGILGRTIRLNARPHIVVGILPPEFEAPLVWGPAEVLVPRTEPPTFRENRRDRWLQAVARLKPDVSISQAQAELSLIASQLEREHPIENAGRGLLALDFSHANMDSVSRNLLWLMTGIAVAMLLIACANLASLQVARAFVRSREFAVRSALGGSRGQLMKPLLSESLLLAVLGGIGGLFVAAWSNSIIGSLLIINNEPGFEIPMDARVLVFAAIASLVSGLAFGLAPAWLASRAPAAEALKEGGRSSVGNRSHHRLKQILIVVELALALTLVGVAAAFGIGAKSFLHRSAGWNADGLFVGYLALPWEPYGDDARSRQFYRDLQPRLAAIPGVEHAALATNLPLFSLGPTQSIQIEGQPIEEASRRPIAQVGTVTRDYFSALEIPLKQGSFFPAEFAADAPAVALVNESFARRFWPNEDPIGRRFRIGDNEEWLQITGVVADVGMLARLVSLDTPLQVYRPLAQATTRYVGVILKTPLAPDTLTRSAREAVASLDPDLPLAQPGSVRAAYERNLANLDLVIVNLSLSAGMGLLIAAVGLFGVISQLTAQRTRDIGVRMALGASSQNILRMILGEGVRLMIVGFIIGVPAYYALTIVLRQAMPAMTLPGLWLLAVNIAVLAITMLVACWLPARRATRINPTEALRSD